MKIKPKRKCMFCNQPCSKNFRVCKSSNCEKRAIYEDKKMYELLAIFDKKK